MKRHYHIGISVLALLACSLMLASCADPAIQGQDARDEFEVSLSPSEPKTATGRDINSDINITNVYAKVFNSSREHLPSTDVAQVTALTHNGTKWTATVHLASPASGTITFLVWAVNASGEHLYCGTGNLTVGTGGNSITVATTSEYALKSMGPGGGYIFYDKGSYSDGWRYLEADYEDYEIDGNSTHIFGHYRIVPSETSRLIGGTSQAIGSGVANTNVLTVAMGDTAFTSFYGEVTTTTSQYAAKLCADLAKNGFSDWFLPSYNELVLINDNLKVGGITGFINEGKYWSSSEDSDHNAWGENFFMEGGAYSNWKENKYPVRAARRF
jgi:hypothetical protein